MSTVEAIAASSLSALIWLDSSGEPQVRGTIGLLRDDVPVIAFTYADEAVARDVAASAQVSLALTETRSTGPHFAPLLLQGRPRLVEDPSGDIFAGELLDQELRRFPPSRVYADSPLLRREHWWFLPRLLVEIAMDSVSALPASSGPDHHLLAVVAGGGVDVRMAGIVEESPQSLVLSAHGSAPAAAPAILFGQDASFPDLERWSQWRYRGAWDPHTFQVADAPAWTGLGPPRGLLQRWRRQRTLERRCIRAIPPS